MLGGHYMKTTRKLLLLLLLLPQLAWAGFHVEPYLGYSFGESLSQKRGAQEFEWDSSYVDLGARLGYGMLGLSFGLDYNMTPGTRTFDQTAPSTGTGLNEWTGSNMGVFVAYELPILLRVWGSYYFNSKLELDTDKDNDGTNEVGDEYSGSGMELGVGFTGLPFVSINLQYRMNSYDEFKNVSAGTTVNYPNTVAGSTTEELKTNSILLSVSVPLDL